MKKSVISLGIACVIITMLSTVALGAEFQYGSGTGKNLESFISTNGPGTYHINGVVKIDTPMIISTPNVKIVSDSPHYRPQDTGLNGVFDILIQSKVDAISVTTSSVSFQGLLFKQSATSQATMLALKDYYQTVDECAFYVGDGVGIKLDGAWWPQLSRIMIESHASNIRKGVGVAFAGKGGHDAVLTDVYTWQLLHGFYATCYSGVYMDRFNAYQCSYGMYLAPKTSTYGIDGCVDMFMESCVFDGNQVTSIYQASSFKIHNFMMADSWMSNGGAPNALYGLYITNANNVGITGGLFYEGGPSGCDNFRISNTGVVLISGAMIHGSGDAVHVTDSSNVKITGNVIANTMKVRHSGVADIKLD